MIAFSVAFCATVNAATATWACSGLKTATATGAFSDTALSGAIAYLFVADAVPTGMEAAILDGTFDTTYAGTAIANKATSSTGAITMAGIGSYASETVNMYMVVFDAATSDAASNYMISSVVSQTYGTSGNKTFNFTTKMPSEWSAIAVPEPTSGLLMLVGLAGLALRRRRA